jgi:non-heme chloroperoxidase
VKHDARWNSHTIESADGTRLFVEETGDTTKPAVLWLHGYCQNRLCWEEQFTDEVLASQYHMVRLDLRGHGLSDKPTDPTSFQESKTWADDLHTIITALHLQKPTLAGWSYGGYLLCDYIRHYGQNTPAGLIFVAAATEMGYKDAYTLFGPTFLQLIPGFFSTDYTEGSAALQQLTEMLTYKELDPPTFYSLLGIMAVTLPASRRGMFTRRLDNRALMSNITIPTLIVQGAQDRVVLPASSAMIARHLPHATSITYKGCGHMPFTEEKERFNRDIAAFLQSIHG